MDAADGNPRKLFEIGDDGTERMAVVRVAVSESINELSESIRGTVSDVSACVTDSRITGVLLRAPDDHH
jgi:hypothetical protein